MADPYPGIDGLEAVLKLSAESGGNVDLSHGRKSSLLQTGEISPKSICARANASRNGQGEGIRI